MVIVEKQSDGRYALRGRGANDRSTVPYWPTGSASLIRAGAHRLANPKWIKECIDFGRRQASELTWMP